MLNYKTGVVGAGMATLMAGHGCEVTIVGLDEDDLRRCRGILEGNLDELVQQGLATEKNRAAILRRFTLTTDTQALKDCIFVLEAAFEDVNVKKRHLPAGGSRDRTRCTHGVHHLGHPGRTADRQHGASRALRRHAPVPTRPYAAAGRAGRRPEHLTRDHRPPACVPRGARPQVVTLHKSVPGFIINRLAQALFRESLYLVEQGVVSVADIDKAIKYAVGMRYASIGLLEYFDDVGFNLECDISKTVYPDLCSTRAIQQIVLDGLASGKTGRSVGLGLYDWSKKDDVDYLRRKAAPYYACFHWDMPED